MSEDPPGVDVDVDRSVLRVTIRRPERMNAVTVPAMRRIGEAFERHAGDPAVRVAVLTGAGRAFCTGADLSGGTKIGTEPDPVGIDVANRTIAAIRDFPSPVVGAMSGPAAGVGVSLALACDLVVAAESSYLLLAFTRIGLMPDGGSTALVAASVGRARALRMALLAERLSARDAAASGLISDVFPDDEYLAGVEALTARLATGPAEAFRVTKDAINAATLGQLDHAFALERAGQVSLLASADFAEGVGAFRERRPAAFASTASRSHHPTAR